MKKTLLFALALAAICILPSCKKDPAQTKIVFGNTKGMSVTSYEGILYPVQYGHYSWGNTLDLDGDGENDVQFHSTSEIMGGGILTELYCLNNTVALLGDITNQQFYLWANNANESFGNDNCFMSTDVKLREGDIYYFSINEAKYIGFKITEKDKSRLGWIKVIHHPDYVEILEIAIQK